MVRDQEIDLVVTSIHDRHQLFTNWIIDDGEPRTRN